MRPALATLALPLVTLACAVDDRDLTVKDPAIPLLPNGDGFIDGTNAARIVGSWGYFVDTPVCMAAGYREEQCSLIDDPSGGPLKPGTLVHPTDLATGRLCISGVAAKVLVNPTTMQPDYGVIWGAGLQLELRGGMQPYDAPARGITGFSFEIDTPAPNMRIAFPNSGSNDPYWGGSDGYASPVRPGLNIVWWEDVAPQFDIVAPPFDAHAILLLQIHVSPSATEATPFDFCVWNIAARTD